MRRNALIAPVLTFVLASAMAVFILQNRAPAASVPPSEQALHYSFAPLVKRVAPAVVNVYASRTVQRQASPFLDDPFFRQFFGGGGEPRARVQRSLGSGVIIDPSGIIVTNYHVIANADEVKVALADKRELGADIVLKDERMDLAVLRIRGGGTFPTVGFADSDALAVGDLVLAIGDPFGVGQTVTSGIVSALARTEVGASYYQFYIQTDAAINPGNSGGALVDMDGRLVGINTAIYSRSGGSIGIGFAIPSNMAKIFVQAALSGKAIQMPWIGADFQPLTGDLAQGLGTDRSEGAIVASVTDNGPAAGAGLKPGDLVVSVDGTEINDPAALNYRLLTKGVGQSVSLGLVRAGQPQTLVVRLIAPPEVPPRDERVIDAESPFAGLTVANLSPAVIAQIDYKGRRTKGVVVEKVAEGSLAARFGFQVGDVVVEVNGVAIDGTGRLASISERPADLWRLAVERDGQLIRTTIGG